MTVNGGPTYLGDNAAEAKPGDGAISADVRVIAGAALIPEGVHIPTAKEIENTVTKQIEILDAYVGAVMKALKPQRGDVVNYGGNPYFRGFGSDRIRAAARVSITGVRMDGPIWSKDARGDFYLFRCYGTLSHQWLGMVESVGTCTSRAQFFAKRSEWVDDPERPGKKKKVPYYLPAEDVPMGNIERTSYTEMARKGLESLLGLKGVTWAELEKYGIRQADCISVTFKEGGQSRGKAKAETGGGQRGGPTRGRREQGPRASGKQPTTPGGPAKGTGGGPADAKRGAGAGSGGDEQPGPGGTAGGGSPGSAGPGKVEGGGDPGSPGKDPAIGPNGEIDWKALNETS